MIKGNWMVSAAVVSLVATGCGRVSSNYFSAVQGSDLMGTSGNPGGLSTGGNITFGVPATPTPTATPEGGTPTASPLPSATPEGGTSTASPVPSATPSVTPTATPSVKPSATPSVTPTATPSVTPTASPSSTAGHSPEPSASPSSGVSGLGAAILVLDPHASGSMRMNGNAAISVSKGKIVVNSDSLDALQLTGNAQASADEIDITGEYSLTGNAKIGQSVKTGTKPMADPLASLAAPATASLPVMSGQSIHKDTKLKPGVYTGSITIGAQATVTMEPGIYVLQQGMNVTGQATINGEGVLLYIAGGTLSFSGGSQGSLSPAKTGAYAGITVFQARSNSSAASMSGNSAWTLGGTFYFPDAQVEITGDSDLSQPMSLIVDQLVLSGNGGI